MQLQGGPRECKPNMHVWWCLIDFGLIFEGFRAHFAPKFHFEDALGWTLGLFWVYFGIMEVHWRGGWEPGAGKSISERGEPCGAPPFWVQKWVCEPPERSPKPPQRPSKSNESCEKKQSSTNWYTLCVWRWIFGEFGCQNDYFCKQISKIKLLIVSIYRMCNNMQNPLVFQWFWGFEVLDV